MKTSFMNNNKLAATIILVTLGFSSSLILFLYQTARLEIETAQNLAVFFFVAFIIFGAGYLYFDLKNLDKK